MLPGRKQHGYIITKQTNTNIKMNTIKLEYGNSQHLISKRMQSSPFLAWLLNKTVGYTNIGNYARSKVFKKHLSKLDLANMDKILDLGCGYGDNAIMMSKYLLCFSINDIMREWFIFILLGG